MARNLLRVPLARCPITLGPMKPLGKRRISSWKKAGKVVCCFLSSSSFRSSVFSSQSTPLQIVLPYPGIPTVSLTSQVTGSIMVCPLGTTTILPMWEMSPPVAYRVWNPIRDITWLSRLTTLTTTKVASQMRSVGSPTRTLPRCKPAQKMGIQNGAASSRQRPMGHISIPMSKSFGALGMNF